MEPIAPLKLPNVRKIAVLRANNVGDYVFTLPALQALRETYPAAELVLLGRPWHAAFLKGRPGPVDRVFVVPPYAGVRDEPGHAPDPAEQERFFAQMRAEQFDLALQLHGGGRNSNPFVLQLGARFTAGLRTPDAPTLDRWVPYIYYQPEIWRYLEVVTLVGARTARLQPEVALLESDLAESLEVVPASTEPLVLLHPGATDVRRWWPAEKFAAVGDVLVAAGAQVLITGTPEEQQQVEAVVAAMRSPARPLVGALSLGGLAGLISRAALLVANDTGPLHLAAALNTASVGIYWCSNLLLAGPTTRAMHRTAIAWRSTCPVCAAPLMHTDYARPHCDHNASWVADVPVEEVVMYALELLPKR